MQKHWPENGTIVIPLHGGPGGDYRYLLPCKDLADKGYRLYFMIREVPVFSAFPKKSYTSLGQALQI
ncbi:hypothetical protein EJ377_03955 [Chryseobacterium arthrosphaerae]|uniref:Alpha/beta hydrolase n=1 Tax=Chryseobacterium arthrosphaerae TaxID=651561 RepID=A0A3S0VJ96_9FLAO|nr:hypothetical protein EJ377_03955 [Chryseobacterium arthrosphaerae]